MIIRRNSNGFCEFVGDLLMIILISIVLGVVLYTFSDDKENQKPECKPVLLQPDIKNEKTN